MHSRVEILASRTFSYHRHAGALASAWVSLPFPDGANFSTLALPLHILSALALFVHGIHSGCCLP